MRALLGTQLRRQLHLDARVEIALVTRLANCRHSESLETEDLAVLCQRRDAQPCGFTGQRLHVRFAAQHRRIAYRRGMKRATMAVAHSQLCICWELLKHGQVYKDLGRDYFERTDDERVKRQSVKRLERLGYTVTLEKKNAA